MDERARLRTREWRGYGEPVEQSAAIMDGIREGTLDYKMVQLAAFLGHEASRLVAYDTKPSGIVISSKLLRNSDMGELATGIGYFGSKAISVFNLGLARMAFAERNCRHESTRRGVTTEYFTYKETNVVYLPTWIGVNTYFNETYGNNVTERIESLGDRGVPASTWYEVASRAAFGNKDAIKELKAMPTDPYQNAGRGRSYNILIPKIVLNLVHEGLTNERSRAKVLKFCNGFYDDQVILKYTSEQVLPWALGEFYEGFTTPAFASFAPFVSTIDEFRARRTDRTSGTTTA